MKRILPVLLSVLLILCSCGTPQKEEAVENVQENTLATAAGGTILEGNFSEVAGEWKNAESSIVLTDKGVLESDENKDARVSDILRNSSGSFSWLVVVYDGEKVLNSYNVIYYPVEVVAYDLYGNKSSSDTSKERLYIGSGDDMTEGYDFYYKQ